MLDERITILITTKEKKRLKIAAVLLGVTMTEIIRLGMSAMVSAIFEGKGIKNEHIQVDS